MLPPPAATTPTSGGVGDLAVAGLAPHLHRGLVQEAVAVQPAGRELAAVRVERQHARRARCAAPPSMNGPLSPTSQNPSASIHDIVRNEKPSYACSICTSAGFRSVRVHSCAPGVAVRHRREVVELVPRRPTVQRGAHRLDPQRRLPQVRRAVDARDDHRGRAVARHVAVEQARTAS